MKKKTRAKAVNLSAALLINLCAYLLLDGSVLSYKDVPIALDERTDIVCVSLV